MVLGAASIDLISSTATVITVAALRDGLTIGQSTDGGITDGAARRCRPAKVCLIGHGATDIETARLGMCAKLSFGAASMCRSMAVATFAGLTNEFM